MTYTSPWDQRSADTVDIREWTGYRQSLMGRGSLGVESTLKGTGINTTNLKPTRPPSYMGKSQWTGAAQSEE